MDLCTDDLPLFLPVRRWFLYAYILGFVGLSVGFGYVIKNLGISEVTSG